MISPDVAERTDAATAHPGHEWWRTAVIYQIYPRSFADADGDGIGDLPGITARLDDLRRARRRRVWLSPFQRSPQTRCRLRRLRLLRRRPAVRHAGRLRRACSPRRTPCGLRVIVDLVPNHSSATSTCGSRRRWPRRRAAPSAPATCSATARARRRAAAEQLGVGLRRPAWTRVTEPDGTPGQWYLHLFDASQPDLDWDEPEVREEFRGILRFWLDRGVDGFRVDVAHGLVKAGRPPRLHAAERSMRRLLGLEAATSECRRRRRTGARTACTRSTATGTRCSRVRRRPRALRRGMVSSRSRSSPAGSAPTRCIRRSTSPTSRRRGMRRRCATSSTSRSPRSAPSALRAPGCCRTTTSSGTRRVSP